MRVWFIYLYAQISAEGEKLLTVGSVDNSQGTTCMASYQCGQVRKLRFWFYVGQTDSLINLSVWSGMWHSVYMIKIHAEVVLWTTLSNVGWGLISVFKVHYVRILVEPFKNVLKWTECPQNNSCDMLCCRDIYWSASPEPLRTSWGEGLIVTTTIWKSELPVQAESLAARLTELSS